MERILQLKISLVDSTPPVWRRLIISGSTTLSDFHNTLQLLFGWSDRHLHQFHLGQHLLSADEAPLSLKEKEAALTLDTVLKKEGDGIIYDYDFGDKWRHRIILEEHLPPDKLDGTALPFCSDGQGACPPEDCGGIPGYREMLSVLKNPDHPEHQEVIRFVGSNWDASIFDSECINQKLHQA